MGGPLSEGYSTPISTIQIFSSEVYYLRAALLMSLTIFLAGLSTAPKAQSYLISPADMPDLTAPSLAALLTAHCASDQQKITLPMQVDRRGNPIIIPHGCVKDILADPQNLGCHGFTRKNPDRTHLFETPDPTFFRDIDTPGDLAKFIKNNSLSSLGLSC